MKVSLLILISSLLTANTFAKELPTEQEAKKVFAQYCHKGKQVKTLSESFVAKILPGPKGIPIDEAEAILTKRKNGARKLASQIYYTHYDQECSAQGTIADGVELADGVEFYRGKNKIQLAWYDLPTLETLDVLRRHYTLRMPIAEQKKIFVSDKVREEYFRPSCSEYDGCIGDVGYFGHNASCKFSASRAISDMQRVYEVIGQRFSTMTNAPGKHPNEINFKVDLDITVICSYGILKSDLLSK